MASASRSEWERQQAALRRELERQARERARLEKEREIALQQQHLASQQEKAVARTAALNRRIAILDQVLTSILTLQPLSFEQMKVSPQLPHFDPGPLGKADPAPDWNFTSWFGRASEEFAKRNRITLINGAELKQLIKEHLNMDVLPGTSPPRRLRASDNVQIGRPGPTQ